MNEFLYCLILIIAYGTGALLYGLIALGTIQYMNTKILKEIKKLSERNDVGEIPENGEETDVPATDRPDANPRKR